MVVMLLLTLHAFAQEDANCQLSTVNCQLNKEVLHSTMIGVGSSNVLDTYLSSYNYTGTDYRIQRETMRMTNLWKGRVANQSLIDVNADINENHAGNLDEYAGGVRYTQGWFYNFMNGNVVNPVERSHSRFNFAAGLSASGYLGVVYISRSGNNPAQAKADLMPEAIEDDKHYAKYIKMMTDDPDVPDDVTMRIWYAKMVASGKGIPFEEFLD